MRVRIATVVAAAATSVLLAGALSAAASVPASKAQSAGKPGAPALTAAGRSSPAAFHYNYAVMGVSAITRSDAWAVGSYSAAGKSHVLILHWNGRSWTRAAVPALTASSSLNAVSAISRSDVWAVGHSSRDSLILHWNGRKWSQVPSPSPGQLSTGLSGVAGVSATSAWAVGTADNDGGGQVLILRWNGRSWARAAPASLGSVSFLSGVAAVSRSDAWAVGEYYPTGASQSSVTLILRWNGTTWSHVPSPNAGRDGNPALNAVSAASASSAWAVGNYEPSSRTVEIASLTLRWSGGKWRAVASPDPRGSFVTHLEGVSAVSASNAWAVGWYATRSTCCAVTRALIRHWNGRKWSQVAIPNPGRPGHHNNSLAAVSSLSARNARAVGSSFRGAVQDSLILHWNGRAWTG